MKTIEEYVKEWIRLSEKVAKEGFVWSSLEENDDWHQYMSLEPHMMSKKQFESIAQATESIGNIYNKMYRYILDKEQELLRKLGLPYETWEAAFVPNNYFSYFTRLDLVVNGQDIKLLEVNADTPTGYLETSVANRILCEEKGLTSPNNLEDAVHNAWEKIKQEYTIDDTVYFTSYKEHDEDRETVLFNMRYSGLEKVKYIGVEDIVVTEDGLADTEGEPIRFLYRLYPLEYLVDDVDSSGKRIGLQFLDHIAQGRVTVFNPPSAYLMQSKAIMALIWERRNDNDLFSKKEQSDIEKYFLPTYQSVEPLLDKGVAYVSKPVLGREGGSVRIYDQNSSLVEKDEEDYYKQYSNIYQEYVEMPEKTVETWDGPYTGKMLTGSFLVGGKSAGLFLRVGEKITGNLSMFVPVAIE